MTAAAPLFFVTTKMFNSTSLMRATGETNSTHQMFQLFKQDGVTPLIGGIFCYSKEGMKIRGRAGLSHLGQGPPTGLIKRESSFLPLWKPSYDVDDPNAGWVSYNSTRRGGFRPRNYVEHA